MVAGAGPTLIAELEAQWQRPQDHAAVGQPRLPLEPDGPDARRLPRRARRPHLQPADACRSSPTSPANSPATRSPPPTTGSSTPAKPCASPTASAPSTALGVARHIEIGPGSTLTALARTITDTPVAPALRAKRPEPEAFANLIAHAHLTGLTPDWHALHPTAQRAELPTYAFQRRHFWLTGDPTGDDGLDHPLLSARLQLAGEDRWAFTSRLSLATHPWIADHKVFGTVLLPGTGLVELALAAGERVGCPVVADLTLEAPLVLPDQGALELQVSVGEGERRELGIFTRPAGDDEATWVRHAAGVLAPEDADVPELDAQWPPAGAEELAVDSLYDRLADMGFDYGPRFQAVGAAWRRGEEVFADVAIEDADRYGIAPRALRRAVPRRDRRPHRRRRARHAAAAVRVQRRQAGATRSCRRARARSRRSATAASS